MLSSCYSSPRSGNGRRTKEIMTVVSYPPTTFVHSQVSILATSSSSIKHEHMDLMYNRKLCADRRGFFDHLTPNRIAYNVRGTINLLLFATMDAACSLPLFTHSFTLTIVAGVSCVYGSGDDDHFQLLVRRDERNH